AVRRRGAPRPPGRGRRGPRARGGAHRRRRVASAGGPARARRLPATRDAARPRHVRPCRRAGRGGHHHRGRRPSRREHRVLQRDRLGVVLHRPDPLGRRGNGGGGAPRARADEAVPPDPADAARPGPNARGPRAPLRRRARGRHPARPGDGLLRRRAVPPRRAHGALPAHPARVSAQLTARGRGTRELPMTLLRHFTPLTLLLVAACGGGGGGGGGGPAANDAAVSQRVVDYFQKTVTTPGLSFKVTKIENSEIPDWRKGNLEVSLGQQTQNVAFYV